MVIVDVQMLEIRDFLLLELNIDGYGPRVCFTNFIVELVEQFQWRKLNGSNIDCIKLLGIDLYSVRNLASSLCIIS